MLRTQRDRTAYLERIGGFTAGGFTDQLVPLIRRAYAAGCTVAEVLAAIEAGKALGDVPPMVLWPAWRAAHDWAWMARRRIVGVAEDVMTR